jgi:glycosyltransferase involved in cell wall biosynthesis
MPRAPRTLFVAPQLPWPLDVGSKIRTYNLLSAYAALGPVTLVCFALEDGDPAAAKELSTLVEAVHLFPLESRSGLLERGKSGALAQTLRTVPQSVRRFTSAALTQKLEQLLVEEDFDFLHVERVFMADNLRALLRSPAAQGLVKVLDVDDIESLKASRLLRTEPAPLTRRFWGRLDLAKLRAFERAALRRFDVALVCSRADQQWLGAVSSGADVEVFCNGADVTPAQAAPRRDDGRTLLFLGAMSYRPNSDAALYFAREVFPLVRREIPDARFVVVGRSPPAELEALADGTHLEVRGFVADKDAVLAACSALVAPIRAGGGTRLKILEAMAARLPVVSTTVGCEGIDVTPGRDLLVADSANDFATACVTLLRDRERHAALSAAGFELVSSHYRWSEIRREFGARLQARLRQLEGTN